MRAASPASMVTPRTREGRTVARRSANYTSGYPPLSDISVVRYTRIKIQVSREVSWCPRLLLHGSIELWQHRAPEGECTSLVRKCARRLRSSAGSAWASGSKRRGHLKLGTGSDDSCKHALEAASLCQDADGRGSDTGPADARSAMNHLLPSSLVLLLLDVCPFACDVTFAMT